MRGTSLARRTVAFTRKLISSASHTTPYHTIPYHPIPCLPSYLIYSDIFNSDLSARLNLSQEEGEKWIVNLIRDMRMGADAKIDLEKVRLPPASPTPPSAMNLFQLPQLTSQIERNPYQPPTTAAVPVRDREDARARIPYSSPGGSDESASGGRTRG